jgi:hypothetical protein
VVHVGELINVYKIFVGKSDEKRPLWRIVREDNIKMDLKMGGHGLDSYSSRDRFLAGCCEPGNEPSGSIKGGTFLN